MCAVDAQQQLPGASVILTEAHALSLVCGSALAHRARWAHTASGMEFAETGWSNPVAPT